MLSLFQSLILAKYGKSHCSQTIVIIYGITRPHFVYHCDIKGRIKPSEKALSVLIIFQPDQLRKPHLSTKSKVFPNGSFRAFK